MRKRLNAVDARLTCVAALCLLSSACVRSGDGALPSPQRMGSGGQSVVQLLPESTSTMLFMDLRGAREAPFYGPIEQTADDLKRAARRMSGAIPGVPVGPEEALSELEGFERVMGKARWVLFATVASPGADGGQGALSFIAAELSEQEVKGFLQAGSKKEDGEPPAFTTSRQGDWTLIALDEDLATQLFPNVWVFGKRAAVLSTLERTKTPGGNAPSIVAQLAEPLAFFDHHVSLVAREFEAPDAAKDELLDPDGFDWSRNIRDVALWVDLGKGVRSGGFLVAPSPDAAQRLGEKLSPAALARSTEGVVQSAFGLHRLAEKVHTRTSGEKVHFEVELDERTALLYWGKISGALGAGLAVAHFLRDILSGFAD